MRTTLLLLLLATTMSSCSMGDGPGGSGRSAEAVEAATTETAHEAVPLAVMALVADRHESYGQWTSCMAISWRYEVFGTITAREGDPAEQLESVRKALLDAGYEDVTKVDGHVTVERGEMTVDVQQPGAARGAGQWQFSVASRCADYDGDERARVEKAEPRPIKGLTR